MIICSFKAMSIARFHVQLEAIHVIRDGYRGLWCASHSLEMCRSFRRADDAGKSIPSTSVKSDGACDGPRSGDSPKSFKLRSWSFPPLSNSTGTSR